MIVRGGAESRVVAARCKFDDYKICGVLVAEGSKLTAEACTS